MQTVYLRPDMTHMVRRCADWQTRSALLLFCTTQFSFVVLFIGLFKSNAGDVHCDDDHKTQVYCNPFQRVVSRSAVIRSFSEA
jgi:hypothetical protein